MKNADLKSFSQNIPNKNVFNNDSIEVSGSNFLEVNKSAVYSWTLAKTKEGARTVNNKSAYTFLF